jgi:peptidoglycan/LPS O-acetylase OafA/YrhL
MGILQQARPDSSSLVSIQALRAIASLLVFWGHAINAVTSKVAAEFPHLYGSQKLSLIQSARSVQ